jgi:hypothetical protein
VSFATNFDEFPVGSTIPMSSPFAASEAGTVRQIVNGGRNGSRALSLQSTGDPNNRVLRVGTQTQSAGRANTVRLGFSFFTPSLGSSWLQNASPTNPSVGTPLFDLRVAARRSQIDGYTYTLWEDICTDGGGAIAWFNNEGGTGESCFGNPTSWGFGILEDGKQVLNIPNGGKYRLTVLTVGINSEGRLRVVRGATNGSESTPEVLAESSQALTVGGWHNIECLAYIDPFLGPPNGYVKIWVNGDLVIDATDVKVSVQGRYDTNYFSNGNLGLPWLPLPNTATGKAVYNADDKGFCDVGIYNSFGLAVSTSASPKIDDFYVVANPVSSEYGDVTILPLRVIADGAAVESAIIGTTPAATNWESVTESDGEVTAVSFANGDRDQYVKEDLALTEDLRVVLVSATVLLPLDGGLLKRAGLRLSTVDGSGAVAPSPVVSQYEMQGDEYQTVTRAFEKAPDGTDWTPAKLNALNIDAKRTR